jgi:hypothetical protein
MIKKIIKGVWFFSLMGLVVIFFYVYASLPEMVLYSDDGLSEPITKNLFFYGSVFVLAIVNALVFMVNKFFSNNVFGFSEWFYGLVVTFNCFFIAVLSFLYVLNGGDKYNFNQMGPIIYGSLILIVVWMISWPVVYFFKKSSSQ